VRTGRATEARRGARARARGEGPARGRAQCRAGDPDGAPAEQVSPLPVSPEIDLDALIEPARVIGGDLYDFLLIDQNRLFFAIADVSGKGIPAALFMAMTKEVLRAAVVRNGTALDHAMAEANAKIAAASADLTEQGAT